MQSTLANENAARDELVIRSQTVQPSWTICSGCPVLVRFDGEGPVAAPKEQASWA